MTSMSDHLPDDHTVVSYSGLPRTRQWVRNTLTAAGVPDAYIEKYLKDAVVLADGTGVPRQVRFADRAKPKTIISDTDIARAIQLWHDVMPPQLKNLLAAKTRRS